MSTPSATPLAGADLFDRWTAHRRANEAVQAAPADEVRQLEVPRGPTSAEDAGRAVLAALSEPDPEHRPPVAPPVAKVSPVVRPTPAPAPGLVLFAPRRGARRLLTVASALGLVAVGVACLMAWDLRSTTSYAVLGGLTLLAFALGSARGRATGTVVSIEDGILRIAQGPSQHRFPLTSAYPPIDVLGEPTDRGWKVLIQRKGMGPFVVTSRMVDAVEFTEALRRFRPQA